MIGQAAVTHARDDWPFDDAVDQQLAGDAADLVLVERALDQVAVSRGDAKCAGQSQFGRSGRDGRTGPIGLTGRRINVNFPQHLESFLARAIRFKIAYELGTMRATRNGAVRRTHAELPANRESVPGSWPSSRR